MMTMGSKTQKINCGSPKRRQAIIPQRWILLLKINLQGYQYLTTRSPHPRFGIIREIYGADISGDGVP
jgi:hypothetical protein